MSDIRLQVKNITKHFGINRALNNVSFNINKGEVHALIGENGSGKSTLTNMLTGIYPMESGHFILDGEEIHPKNQVDANNHGVSIIVQELGTLSGLTVAENIFLGHEERFIKYGIRNTKAMNNEANALLKQYGFTHIKASTLVDDYKFEDRKLIEIVKATYFHPKIVVIDETTTALSQEGREELYKHMNRIRDEGNTVIFISHDLPEILDKSDTITILRDGEYIDTIKSKDVTEDDLKKLMVGREVTGAYYRTDYDEKVSDEVVLSVKNVSVPHLIQNVSFDLHKGEILGFGGLSESGMHEIGKAIFGASYDREGEVVLAVEHLACRAAVHRVHADRVREELPEVEERRRRLAGAAGDGLWLRCLEAFQARPPTWLRAWRSAPSLAMGALMWQVNTWGAGHEAPAASPDAGARLRAQGRQGQPTPAGRQDVGLCRPQ